MNAADREFRHKAAFRAVFFQAPADEAPVLLAPSMEFSPDSMGGYGVPALGSRHAVLDRSAPDWLRALVESIAQQNAGQELLLRRTGRAGKVSFYALPQGVATVSELVAATDAAVRAKHARISGGMAERIVRYLATADKIIADRGGVSIDPPPSLDALTGMVEASLNGELADDTEVAAWMLPDDAVLAAVIGKLVSHAVGAYSVRGETLMQIMVKS